MVSSVGPTSAGHDQVLPLTRVVSAVIIPFLIVAFVVLYPFPHDTGSLFAWEINPTVTPMILGSVYLGGAYFFVRAARASAWHTVEGGFIPVGLFASLMGLATILHWHTFNQDHVAFWLWVGLYFTTPWLIFYVWFANRSQRSEPRADDVLLPKATADLIAVIGGAASLMSVLLFVFPSRAIDLWPWMVSRLTARVMGAIFALGTAGLGALTDRRWSAARILFQVEGFMLALILLAGLRARAEFDTSNILTWLFGAGFVALAVATAALYRRMETRANTDVRAGT